MPFKRGYIAKNVTDKMQSDGKRNSYSRKSTTICQTVLLSSCLKFTFCRSILQTPDPFLILSNVPLGFLVVLKLSPDWPF